MGMETGMEMPEGALGSRLAFPFAFPFPFLFLILFSLLGL